MGKILDEYRSKVASIEVFKADIMNQVVSAIKTISVQPIVIGNMKYFYTEYKGREVPAYWDAEYGEYKPIYDEDSTYSFGWYNFEDCCKVFDVIKEHLHLC